MKTGIEETLEEVVPLKNRVAKQPWMGDDILHLMKNKRSKKGVWRSIGETINKSRADVR